MSKFLASMVAWVLEKIKTIQAAHRESARNALMRLLFALLTFKFAGDLWDSGSLTLWSVNSQSAAIGSLFYSTFSGWAFLIFSLAIIPFGMAELCWWVRRHHRAYAKAAMLALGSAGALYLTLVIAARNTELDVIRMLYARTGIECIVMMLLIGTLLNAQLRADHGLDDAVSESNRVPLEQVAG